MAALERATRRLGMEHFAATFLPLAHERLDSYFIWENWPGQWFDRYLKLNYFHSDPVVRLVRRSGRSVIWSQSLKLQALPSKSKRIMDEASDFGLVDGLTIPLHSQNGMDGVFSVAGRRAKLTPAEVTLLEIVATRAHRRLLDLAPSAAPPREDCTVTKAESECLTWCVSGKTDREIAAMTGRSPRTIQTHIGNLQRKLGAANRAQLVAEAFRRGLQR
ncbi:response regulator containing a CheY-like receiver domain and an HTH DNA-binding domain [Rhizobium sp. CF122]|uniref:helix-turn-helix transcriptional regulator n=1 Tax=Rhizobium sp. CF122 TaxID=1144312 RepID=UPI0002717D6B|nr:LuxR family transcriptional regulator [Rhizobium sp. CF122]EJL56643.1 response regulator containing a CheY-like receiver domain and an HTH DNA-binding domain [Rhizobium sp. CF122]